MVHGEEHAEQVDEDPEQVQDVVTERTLVTFAMNLVQNLILLIILKQRQNVHKLQIATFWDIYINIYKYLYIYHTIFLVHPEPMSRTFWVRSKLEPNAASD